jgi:hypothetical protein
MHIHRAGSVTLGAVAFVNPKNMGLHIGGGELIRNLGKSPLVLAFLIAVATVAVSLSAKKNPGIAVSA